MSIGDTTSCNPGISVYNTPQWFFVLVEKEFSANGYAYVKIFQSACGHQRNMFLSSSKRQSTCHAPCLSQTLSSICSTAGPINLSLRVSAGFGTHAFWRRRRLVLVWQYQAMWTISPMYLQWVSSCWLIIILMHDWGGSEQFGDGNSTSKYVLTR